MNTTSSFPIEKWGPSGCCFSFITFPLRGLQCLLSFPKRLFGGTCSHDRGVGRHTVPPRTTKYLFLTFLTICLSLCKEVVKNKYFIQVLLLCLSFFPLICEVISTQQPVLPLGSGCSALPALPVVSRRDSANRHCGVEWGERVPPRLRCPSAFEGPQIPDSVKHHYWAQVLCTLDNRYFIFPKSKFGSYYHLSFTGMGTETRGCQKLVQGLPG